MLRAWPTPERARRDGAVAATTRRRSSASPRCERQDREVGPDAPRRERLFAAASARGVPLRTILAVDAVVIATWVLYRLLGRLRDVILWMLIAAFIALVLNPAVAALQRHRFRRGAAVGVVFAVAVLGSSPACWPCSATRWSTR